MEENISSSKCVKLKTLKSKVLPNARSGRSVSALSYWAVSKRRRRGSRAGAVVRALASHQCGQGSTPRNGATCGLRLLVSSILLLEIFLSLVLRFFPLLKIRPMIWYALSWFDFCTAVSPISAPPLNTLDIKLTVHHHGSFKLWRVKYKLKVGITIYPRIFRVPGSSYLRKLNTTFFFLKIPTDRRRQTSCLFTSAGS